VRDLLLDERRPYDDSYILREFKALKQASMITPSESIRTNASSSHLSFGGAPTSGASDIVPTGGRGLSFLDSSTTASPPPSSGVSSFDSLDITKIITREQMNEGSPFKPPSADEQSE
jgi:hypothetical protein